MRCTWNIGIAIVTCLVSICMIAQAQNATLLKNINPYNGSTQNPPVLSRDVANGVMYFSMEDGSGKKLWRTDGTAAGTYRYADALVVEDLRVIDDLAYFKGNDTSHGDEPWRSDGTVSGTYMLKDVARQSTVYSHLDFVKYNGKVYFKAAWMPPNVFPNISKSERSLLVTDGTASGTATIGSLPMDNDLCAGSNGIHVMAIDMWFSDGTKKGTNEIVDVCSIFPAQFASCGTKPYTPFPGAYEQAHATPVVVDGLYYSVYGDDQHGCELWVSDGAAQGSSMVHDLNPGPGGSYPSMLTVHGDYIYCGAYAPSTGTELYRFPLTGGAPQLVKDVNPGTGNSEPLWITEMNGMLYFSAYHPDHGRELWRSDGTAAGTVLVKDINPGTADANPRYTKRYTDDERYYRYLTVLNGILYFAADDGNGYELWSSDGTLGGTALAADINPMAGQGSDPHCLTVVNGKLLFLAYEPVYGWEWWVLGSSGNQSPVALATATPAAGNAPLTVNFSSAGSYDPDGSITDWHWDFGDYTSSTQANPTHVFQQPGTYTAQLTVTDNSSATGMDQVMISVTATPSGYVYVAGQTVSRISMPGNKIAAEDVVLIKDDVGSPVSGATVTASYSGPTSGTVAGTTGAAGEVTLTSNWKRNPSGSWCFTVTDVQASGKTYNAAMNVVIAQCESTPKTVSNHQTEPARVILEQNYPNPFNPITTITFQHEVEGHVTLCVFDALGRRVRVLVDEYLAAGMHSVVLDSKTMPSGVYVYQLNTSGVIVSRTMALQK